MTAILNGSDRCLYCHNVFSTEVSWQSFVGIEAKKLLCADCDSKLEPIKMICCDMCGRPIQRKEKTSGRFSLKGKHISSNEQNGDFIPSTGTNSLPPLFSHNPSHLCSDCHWWSTTPLLSTHPVQHRALYTYNVFMQELIAKFKYRGDAKLAELFTDGLKELTKSIGRIDCVTVIPLTDERLWERGFNQSALLAQAFPWQEILQRRGTAGKQSKRGRKSRIAVFHEHIFEFTKEANERIWKDKYILIIDDIYTTGTTLRAAAELFYRRGAAIVYSVTVARAVGQIKNKT
ncbi:ComF family protein [Salipaludibacillus agaradhaerens]|jgi:competence protein ComFC|uniref:ComF family protein n=1 Tax=Salipaludibacillus agaradhaerens TaxID=76935 RepID=UPI0009972F45|nr:phosphoribosyltransferase family protein [Salipaludibacillus agaradhaerens]